MFFLGFFPAMPGRLGNKFHRLRAVLVWVVGGVDFFVVLMLGKHGHPKPFLEGDARFKRNPVCSRAKSHHSSLFNWLWVKTKDPQNILKHQHQQTSIDQTPKDRSVVFFLNFSNKKCFEVPPTSLHRSRFTFMASSQTPGPVEAACC